MTAMAQERDGVDIGDEVAVDVPRNLSAVVSVRLSAADMATIGEAADAAGLKLSAYLREAALNAARSEPMVRERDLVAAVNRLLGKGRAVVLPTRGATESTRPRRGGAAAR